MSVGEKWIPYLQKLSGYVWNVWGLVDTYEGKDKTVSVTEKYDPNAGNFVVEYTCSEFSEGDAK